ncbi:hypothetical protein AZE42_05232 [Rhizopogon vesiculosus]|uniref:Cytidyltransferase-like domain-containing protein n=1 Tax=Rhizopogon vesiculosus TaxID=180088 RepID=A0A1J8QD22_9AGAM|nr:hypothetical protein AZE42_05232 [Rhizopogon vesiculosus]
MAESRTITFTNPRNYTFPSHRLRQTLHDCTGTKQPIVLVACGSINPITYNHLRMYEIANDFVREKTDFEIVGEYLSPVSDEYKKPGLVGAHHRVNMCSLAIEQESAWLMVDPWEVFQNYRRTAVVLDHFDYELNTVCPPQMAFGLMTTFYHILGRRYGTIVIERERYNVAQATGNLSLW